MLVSKRFCEIGKHGTLLWQSIACTPTSTQVRTELVAPTYGLLCRIGCRAALHLRRQSLSCTPEPHRGTPPTRSASLLAGHEPSTALGSGQTRPGPPAEPATLRGDPRRRTAPALGNDDQRICDDSQEAHQVGQPGTALLHQALLHQALLHQALLHQALQAWASMARYDNTQQVHCGSAWLPNCAGAPATPVVSLPCSGCSPGSEQGAAGCHQQAACASRLAVAFPRGPMKGPCTCLR
jgi:hypothetical protein